MRLPRECHEHAPDGDAGQDAVEAPEAGVDVLEWSREAESCRVRTRLAPDGARTEGKARPCSPTADPSARDTPGWTPAHSWLTCYYPQQRADDRVQTHERGGEEDGAQENAPSPRAAAAVDLADAHGHRFQQLQKPRAEGG